MGSPVSPGKHLFAAGLALLGGVFGVLGAFVQELRAGFLVAFVAAPIIEEALKPSGVYVLLVRWPHLLRGRLHTALLSALGGLAFAVIESLVYLNVYFPDHTRALAIYRFSVPLVVHSATSFILGFGINQRLLASVRGEVPFLSGNWPFFVAAMALHALYNIGVSIAQATTGFLKP